MEDEIFFNQSKYIKEMLKKFGLEDSKPTKTPMSTEIKLTKDDEADSVDSSKYQENPKTTHLEAVKRIFSLEVKRNEEDIPYIEFKLDQFTFTLTPSRLSQILKTPHTLEIFYTSEWSLNSLDDHPNSNYFGPKHDIIKKAISVPRTTQAQLLRDPNKLYIDDIHPNLKGWELFFKKNFFFSIDKRNKVKACTAYMFTFHEHVMDPLDILRNPSKEKGKKIASPSVISSSSDNNEAPSFLKFYDELSDSEDLTKAQREKRGMFKFLNRYVGTITKYPEKQK
ncbi:hypothetical protein Tco_1006270 [Tanacetum coccineum]|uniref:Retrovirus-related Pol polyprotein from transposon TNT 1-94 n=1 Tax=Tanacetum coccineum TaxID=301880 RepID=A0ABQ5FJL0_9ASTR